MWIKKRKRKCGVAIRSKFLKEEKINLDCINKTKEKKRGKGEK